MSPVKHEFLDGQVWAMAGGLAVLVSLADHRVDVWSRRGAGWEQRTFLDGEVPLEPLGCSLPLNEVYRDPLA